MVQNGDIVEINKDYAKKKNRVFTGREVLKGKNIIPLDNQIFRNLKLVSSDGEIFVNIILDVDNNLLNEPVIFCPTVSDDNSLIQEIKNLISDIINEIGSKFIDDFMMSEEIKKNVKKLIKNTIGLKPLTYIEIVRI